MLARIGLRRKAEGRRSGWEPSGDQTVFENRRAVLFWRTFRALGETPLAKHFFERQQVPLTRAGAKAAGAEVLESIATEQEGAQR